MSRRSVSFNPFLNNVSIVPRNNSRGIIQVSPLSLENRQQMRNRSVQARPTVIQHITPSTRARDLPMGTLRKGRNNKMWRVVPGLRTGKRWVQTSLIRKRNNSQPNNNKPAPKRRKLNRYQQ